jgi:hypothetical protein
MPDYYIINNDKIENIISAETAEIAKDITDAEEILLRNYEALYDIGWIKNTDLNKWYNPVAPYPSWTLDSNCIWQPPTQKPDGDYTWDEDNTQWIEIETSD